MSTPTLSRTEFASGAVEVLPPDAPREEWLAERRNSIGGSDCSTLVGLNGYGSLMQLFLDKSGLLDGKAITSAMEWGILLEPVVREWFASTYRKTVARVGMLRRPDHPRVHANPDGLVLDEHGVPVAGIEIKTTNWRQAHEWAEDQIPDHAELQAQLCMFISGLSSWYVVGLIDGRDPQVRLVHVDVELGAMLAELAAGFFRDHVDVDEAPALDGSVVTYEAVTAWLGHPQGEKAIALTPKLRELFRAHADAKQAVKDAEEVEREAHARLRIELGDAGYVVDDPTRPLPPAKGKPEKGDAVVYATAINNGTFSSSRLAQEHPDVVAEFTEKVETFVPAKLKGARPELHRQFCARQIRPRKPLTELLAETALEETRT